MEQYFCDGSAYYRHVLHVNEPEKTGARSARELSAAIYTVVLGVYIFQLMKARRGGMLRRERNCVYVAAYATGI